MPQVNLEDYSLAILYDARVEKDHEGEEQLRMKPLKIFSHGQQIGRIERFMLEVSIERPHLPTMTFEFCSNVDPKDLPELTMAGIKKHVAVVEKNFPWATCKVGKPKEPVGA